MTIENEVAWLFELELPPERREAFEKLVPEMLEDTKANEPGSRAYQFFVNGSTLCVYERYADSAAALVHMQAFGEKFAARFMDLVTPVRFTFLGAPSAALAEAIAPVGAIVNAPLAGYSR